MTKKNGKVVRIGCASGFWGDSEVGAPQLVEAGGIDYLVFDYLAETTMAILASARNKKPELGYATDFVEIAMRSVVGDVARKGIKVVSNAGGLNPKGCAAAVAKLAAEAGVKLRIAVVEGDDVSALVPSLREAGQKDMFTGRPLPDRIQSANAYLGALPIAQALAAGADVVITGRCVDSAVVLGPLMHEHGWKATDYDLLASGSLAGHVVECGCQATGGLHTDWERVAAARHRRRGRGADPLRDRRPGCLRPARRRGRLHRGEGGAGRAGSRPGEPRARPRADQLVQGVGDLRRRVPLVRLDDHHRHRRGGEGAA